MPKNQRKDKNTKEKSAKQQKQKIYLPKNMKLTKAEKKALNDAFLRSRPQRGKISAQGSLPFMQITPDGLCRLTETRFSRTLRFFDINYRLASHDDQESIFEGWCDVLNYFGADVSFQITSLTLPMDMHSYARHVTIPPQNDHLDNIRQEYTTMLQNQLSRGNNGLVKTKYITFSVEAPDIKTAKGRLERIEADVRSNLTRLGVSSKRLDGTQLLAVLHNAMHFQSCAFPFNWKWLTPSGLREKDFIVPSSFFFDARQLRIGDIYGTASFVQILASDIKDKVLEDFLEVQSPQIISLHIQSIDHTNALKMVKTKITDLDKTKIDEQKKAVRAGYDMDILPPDLEKRTKDTKALLEDLQSHDEKLFLLTMLIVNTGKDKKQLNNNIEQSAGIAKQYSCELVRLDFQQEQGFFSALPLGLNQLPIQRTMTTAALAGFIPFTTYELFQQEGEPLYCGLNALSSNMIMVDRKFLTNPNGLILGKPGSGKSFSAKREIFNVILVTKDDVIISDPEGEYAPLVSRVRGQIVKISPVSRDYVNPLDLSMHYSDDEDDVLTLKSDFILSLFELITKEGLLPQDISIIDRCVREVYKPYLADPKPKNMPILSDLYREIQRQPEEEAKRLAAAMEIYVTGSLNVFNHQTNVDIQNRVVCFDIKELGNSALKKIGMMVVQDQVWNRVTQNRANKKSTRYYMDEFHLLLTDEQTAAYSAAIWKRFRKWGGIPTGITQNIKDFLNSPKVASIFDNTDYVYLLNQGADDRQILAKQLNISPHQLSYVKNSVPGEGLLIYGGVILPFVDQFPQDTEMYRIMTTRLTEAM